MLEHSFKDHLSGPLVVRGLCVGSDPAASAIEIEVESVFEIVY